MTPQRRPSCTLLFALGLLGCGVESHDLVISEGLVYDGTGQEPRRTDIGIREGRIVDIGQLGGVVADRRIDVRGLVVAPGFIDIHNHSDLTLIDEPRCQSMVRQGVTTMVLGEGGSAGPVKPGERPWSSLGEYFEHVERKGVAANIASYVGQTQIWTYIKGYDLRPANAGEIDAMKREVDRAMREGAMGLSSSLLMPPSSLITTEQLIELAKVAAAHGGIYSTHIRDEGRGVFESVDEAIDIGKGADIRVDIIHLKIAHREFWGRMDAVLRLIHRARLDGHDIRANVYPYTAGQNNLRAIIPPWAHDGGNKEMLKRLRSPHQRARLRKNVLEGMPDWYNHYLATGGGWEGILLVSLEQANNRPFVGKRMSDLIAARGGDPVEVLFDVLLEENGSVPAVFFHHAGKDMRLALRQEFTSVGSDGAAISPTGPRGDTHPHPRWYGTFPRVLGRYVREEEVLDLSDAIHKMTGMNADKINLKDRGLLQEGYAADITVFNPQKVIDRATFEDPHQYADGIELVIVNGVIVLEEGEHTGALPGRVLRGPGYVYSQ